MADPTPEAAIERLMSLSADVRAVVIAEPDSTVSACSEEGPRADEMARLALDLFEQAEQLPGDRTDQLEAQVDSGAVYAVREPDGRVLVAVTDRAALSSLMFYDLRAALHGVGIPA
jgi:predicted regulator of Ras-like GTPase activity (Roadblock/LC7/MglB family)